MGLQVRWFRGDTDVTEFVDAGNYQMSLKPGKSKYLRVKVKATFTRRAVRRGIGPFCMSAAMFTNATFLGSASAQFNDELACS